MEVNWDKYKYVAFDLDGTLIDYKGNLFEHVLEGLASLRKYVDKIFLVTGRTLHTFRQILDLDFIKLLDDPIILNDGNAFLNIRSNYYGIQDSLPLNLSQWLVVAGVQFVLDSNGVQYASSSKAALKFSMLYNVSRQSLLIREKSFLSRSKAAGIVIFGNPNSRLLAICEESRATIKPLKYLDSHLISPINIDKSTALKATLKNQIGIESLDKVIAFGDGVNDVSMLKGCGIGITVPNSHPDAVNASDFQIQTSVGIYLTSILS